jgi:hypothetical protein
MALISFVWFMLRFGTNNIGIVFVLFLGLTIGLGYAIYPLIAPYLQDEAYIHWITWQSSTQSESFRQRLSLAAKHWFFAVIGGQYAVVILAVPQILLFPLLGIAF